MRLKDKIAIVTGAHQGIGQGVAIRYAQEGAVVYCADIGDCAETVAKITETQGRARAAALNVAQEASWKALADQVVGAHGRIDILANVAGVVARGPDNPIEISMEEWDRVIGVDLRGVWLGVRTALPHMLRNSYGKIVNVSSLAAIRGLPNLFAYSTAKGGVAAMTRQIAVEYANRGINANTIAPGTINTPILADCRPELIAQNAAAHAINRLGLPSDIAALATFLASDESGFITGLEIPCDGGWSVK